MLLSILTLVAYSFPVGTHLTYDVSVSFDGYLPVLRGRNALADLSMTVDVQGAEAAANGNPRVTSEIKAFKLKLNSAVLPFGPENIGRFFPKTTIECSALGRLIKTNAPDVRLPVSLPGLDVKRFPDITYLPLEFPTDGIEEGKVFKFEKPFGDGPVQYEVTTTKIGSENVDLDVKLHQRFRTFEDDARNPSDEKDAVTSIETELTGAGTAKFDLKRNLVSEYFVEANSVGQATDIKTKAVVERKLKTTLKVRLK